MTLLDVGVQHNVFLAQHSHQQTKVMLSGPLVDFFVDNIVYGFVYGHYEATLILAFGMKRSAL